MHFNLNIRLSFGYIERGCIISETMSKRWLFTIELQGNNQLPFGSQDMILLYLNMSRVVRKPAFCICENKDADLLRGNREADQRLCFRYTDSTIPLLPKSEISSFYPSSVTVQPGLCRTWSETPKTGFLITRLICSIVRHVIMR